MSNSCHVALANFLGRPKITCLMLNCARTDASLKMLLFTGTSRQAMIGKRWSRNFSSTKVTASSSNSSCLGRKKLATPNWPSSKFLSPVTTLKKRCDRSIFTPAPSPIPSADMPPLCGMVHKASWVLTKISWVWMDFLCVIKPTPQLSLYFSWSYNLRSSKGAIKSLFIIGMVFTFLHGWRS